MEHWLAQPEMDMMEPNVSTIVDFPYQHQQHQQSGTMEACYDTHLAADALGEDFPYPLSADGEISFPRWEFDYNVMEQFSSAPHIFNNGNYDNINNNNNNDNDIIHSENNIAMSCNNNVEGISQQLQHREETIKQAASGGAKRVRHPRQVQEHIVAERKRRESLSRMFISLTTIVPGLTKMDKTSVLGEAIKYIKQLQQKVKVLEEAAARRTVESIVVVKKSQVIVDNNDGGVGGDNDSSSTVEDHSPSGGSSHEADNPFNSFPEIQVKISGKSLLLRIYTEEQKDVLAKLLAVLDKHGMSVTTCNVTPFDNLALDISIVAKMMERGFNFDVKDFIRSLHCALRA